MGTLLQPIAMQAPVMVLNTQAKRETGHKAQISNIAAAKAVAEIIRTTLGPKSMLKMLLDPMGGIVMTNDGNSILREVDVSPRGQEHDRAEPHPGRGSRRRHHVRH